MFTLFPKIYNLIDLKPPSFNQFKFKEDINFEKEISPTNNKRNVNLKNTKKKKIKQIKYINLLSNFTSVDEMTRCLWTARYSRKMMHFQQQ